MTHAIKERPTNHRILSFINGKPARAFIRRRAGPKSAYKVGRLFLTIPRLIENPKNSCAEVFLGFDLAV
jgi:hypothetical protein